MYCLTNIFSQLCIFCHCIEPYLEYLNWLWGAMKNSMVLNKLHSYFLFLKSMKFDIFIFHRTNHMCGCDEIKTEWMSWCWISHWTKKSVSGGFLILSILYSLFPKNEKITIYYYITTWNVSTPACNYDDRVITRNCCKTCKVRVYAH